MRIPKNPGIILSYLSVILTFYIFKPPLYVIFSIQLVELAWLLLMVIIFHITNSAKLRDQNIFNIITYSVIFLALQFAFSYYIFTGNNDYLHELTMRDYFIMAFVKDPYLLIYFVLIAGTYIFDLSKITEGIERYYFLQNSYILKAIVINFSSIAGLILLFLLPYLTAIIIVGVVVSIRLLFEYVFLKKFYDRL